ncbi:hypothetical protein FJZ21_02150 [Candidatus Pacearchaeota archaeon]|nr:hypothetical protein [Candidatus Pacearchaeota archaeon]
MALTEFVSYMRSQEEIGLAVATLQKEHDVDKRNKAQAYLDEQSLRGAEDLPEGVRLTPEQFSQLDSQGRKAYLAAGFAERQEAIRDDISNSLKGQNLENILDEINPETLEGLASAKELVRGGVQGYDELLQIYQAYLGAKQLEQKYKEGKLDEKERKAITSNVVDEVVKDLVAKNKGKYSVQRLQVFENLARVAVQLGGTNNEQYVERGVKAYVGDAEKKLKDYQTESGKTVLGYVTDSLKALNEDPDPEDSVIARTLIYKAGQIEEKARKKVA